MRKPWASTAAAALLVAGSFGGVSLVTQQGANATQVTTTTETRLDTKHSMARALALFERWNRSLATGNPQKVANQYWPDGVLLPTVDGKVHDTRAERVEYFTHFLKQKPRGTWVEPVVRDIGPNRVLLMGLYDFAVVKDGKPGVVHARATFVFERRGDTWKILHHHSSKLP